MEMRRQAYRWENPMPCFEAYRLLSNADGKANMQIEPYVNFLAVTTGVWYLEMNGEFMQNPLV